MPSQCLHSLFKSLQGLAICFHRRSFLIAAQCTSPSMGDGQVNGAADLQVQGGVAPPLDGPLIKAELKAARTPQYSGLLSSHLLAYFIGQNVENKVLKVKVLIETESFRLNIILVYSYRCIMCTLLGAAAKSRVNFSYFA